MSASRLSVALAALVIGLVASGQRPAPTPAYVQPEASRADTLRYTVRAGETLIVALPPRVAGDEARYEIVKAPALSWLVDRSFMWRTLERERGTLPVELRRLVSGRTPEPVILLVEITQ